jgi:hypothetical protein
VGTPGVLGGCFDLRVECTYAAYRDHWMRRARKTIRDIGGYFWESLVIRRNSGPGDLE